MSLSNKTRVGLLHASAYIIRSYSSPAARIIIHKNMSIAHYIARIIIIIVVQEGRKPGPNCNTPHQNITNTKQEMVRKPGMAGDG